VTADGRLDWQNGLTAANALYFGQCNGIFTNYTWRPHQPLGSAQRAGVRRHDVYTGIDVFGRGSYGGGGFRLSLVRDGAVAASTAVARRSAETVGGSRSGLCAPQALDAILEADTSIALFAPGWTWEAAGEGGRNNAPAKNNQLWWAGPSTT